MHYLALVCSDAIVVVKSSTLRPDRARIAAFSS
jgi:hypothetical protein